jgi:hypothetical protein
MAKLATAVVNTRADGYLPANQIKQRFGLSAYRLQRLAMGNVIRHETRPAVITAYCVEDVLKYLGNQATAEEVHRATASAK